MRVFTSARTAFGKRPGSAHALRHPALSALFIAGLFASGATFAMDAGNTRTQTATCAPDAIPQVKALVAHDPATALKLGKPCWKTNLSQGDRFALGMLLMEAAEAQQQHQKVLDIGEPLDTAALTPLQHMKVAGYLAAHIWVTHDVAKLNAMQTELATLQKQLPDHRETIAVIWRSLAASYYFIHDVDEAQRVAQIAVATVPKHPSKVDYNAYQLIAIGYIQQDKIPEAIEALMAADSAGKALGLPDDPALLQNFTGLFIYSKNWPKAIEYGTRALAAKPPVAMRVGILNDLASAHAEQGDLDVAKATYAQALALAQANHLPTADILNNYGDLLQKHGQSAQALPLFREAIASYEHGGNKASAAIAYSNLGAALVDLGQRQAAAKAFDQSLALFGESDDVGTRLELYPLMIDNLAALGRYRNALALIREYKKTSDDHINVESKTQVAKLESEIELQRQKALLAEATRKQDAQTIAMNKLEAHEQQQRLLGYGMLAALALLALLAAFKMRESRKRQHLNSELAKLNDTIRRQSEEDMLIGLRNRRSGQAAIEQIAADLHDAARRGDQASPALLMLLDIDYFKRINDSYGHEAGDQALLHFSDALRECSRPSDILVRWGGEEFLWICPDTLMADAAKLFIRLRERNTLQPLMLKGAPVPLTVSMGACTLSLGSASGDWATCLRVADAALYRAKALGRDRWVGFTPNKPGNDHAWQDDIAELEARGMLVCLGDTGPVQNPPVATDSENPLTA